jgi:hypothetical protein
MGEPVTRGLRAEHSFQEEKAIAPAKLKSIAFTQATPGKRAAYHGSHWTWHEIAEANTNPFAAPHSASDRQSCVPQACMNGSPLVQYWPGLAIIRSRLCSCLDRFAIIAGLLSIHL